MPFNYLKNFIGVALTDEELQSIPFPRTEVLSHMTLKCVQTGTLIGFTIGIGYSCYKQLTKRKDGDGKGSDEDSDNKEVVSLSYGQAISDGLGAAVVGAKYGLIASVPVHVYLLVLYDDTKFYDLAYRLRINRHVIRLDQAGYLGAALGALVGKVRRGKYASVDVNPMYLGIAGFNVGMLTFFVCSKILTGSAHAILPLNSV